MIDTDLLVSGPTRGPQVAAYDAYGNALPVHTVPVQATAYNGQQPPQQYVQVVPANTAGVAPQDPLYKG